MFLYLTVLAHILLKPALENWLLNEVMTVFKRLIFIALVVTDRWFTVFYWNVLLMISSGDRIKQECDWFCLTH